MDSANGWFLSKAKQIFEQGGRVVTYRLEFTVAHKRERVVEVWACRWMFLHEG